VNTSGGVSSPQSTVQDFPAGIDFKGNCSTNPGISVCTLKIIGDAGVVLINAIILSFSVHWEEFRRSARKDWQFMKPQPIWLGMVAESSGRTMALPANLSALITTSVKAIL